MGMGKAQGMGAVTTNTVRGVVAAALALTVPGGMVLAQQPAEQSAAEVSWATVVNPKAGGAVADGAELTGDTARTRFTLALTRSVQFSAFRLGNPNRVVLDIAGVEFHLPAESGRQGRGLVIAFRHGLIAPGKSRIVLDTTQAVHVESRLVPGAPGDR